MIAVLGCGNMASAIVKGLYEQNDSLHFLTYTPSFKRAKELADITKSCAITDLKDIEKSAYILIGCKPQQFDQLCCDLKEVDIEGKIIISMMAAISVETIQKKLGVSQVVRIMPNTPILKGNGISLLFFSSDILSKQKKYISNLFKSISTIYETQSEIQFDEITTITGSGPAYVYFIMDIFYKRLLKMGVDEKDSLEMILKLFSGSLSLMNENMSFKKQLDKVTSKKGVTIEAINSFDRLNLEEIINSGIDCAIKRSKEIEEEIK